MPQKIHVEPINQDTIVAVATPPGPGGIGVVRLSGPLSVVLADSLFRGKTSLSFSPSHTLHHGVLYDNNEVVDEIVAGLFRNPRSYTGEDVVEFSCHGGPVILERVLNLCLQKGARLAGPGEFTQRAFLNGKMDLSQAEAVAELIASRTDTQRRFALERLNGGVSKILTPLREEVLDLLARVEANLDFSEDDVPAIDQNALIQRLHAVMGAITDHLRQSQQGRVWRDGVRLSLVGRPNAGKSSLFNALLNTRRAIVHEAAGTTRDTLEESVVWDGVPVTLVDTAGLRDTGDTVEREGVQRAHQALKTADVVLLVVDAGTPPDVEERDVFSKTDRPVLLVLNKTDLLAPETVAKIVDRWERFLGTKAVAVSAVTRDGLPVLRKESLSLSKGGGETVEPAFSLNTRQESLLNETLRSLQGAIQSPLPETLSTDLRRALDLLNLITGQGASHEILDVIFSRFCIGK